jgi:hypothetical protein
MPCNNDSSMILALSVTRPIQQIKLEDSKRREGEGCKKFGP